MRRFNLHWNIGILYGSSHFNFIITVGRWKIKDFVEERS